MGYATSGAVFGVLCSERSEGDVKRVWLENEWLRVAIEPSLGAGVAELSLKAGELLHLLRRAPEGASWFNDLGSYLLIPWSNRISGASFAWRGKVHSPFKDWEDGTAIHGQVKDKPWRVFQRSPTMAVLRYSSADHQGQGWPWLFEAEVSYEVRGRELRTGVEVTHVAGGDCADAMPVGVGFHPFWNRSLRGEADDVRVRVRGLKRYPCERMLPTGAAVQTELTRRLGAGTALGTLAMDDVFLGSAERAELEWPGAGVRARYSCSPELGHTVIYTGEPGADGKMPGFFCLEPVSMVNDGFNLATRGWANTGVRGLAVGESMRVWWTVQLESV